MRWVEAREPGWVERRVARFVPICGALLGSAKALAYLVTGEMTDAVGMGPLLAQLFESHGGIQRRARRDLTRSWASVPALLPKGGDAFWRTDDFVVLDEPPADVPERYLVISDAGAPGSGVIAGDGDGTVPILSLGYLCASGYGTKARNPARVRVRTKEYAHEHTTTYDALRSPLDTISGLANDKDSDHITSAAPRPPFAIA
ncbi:O-acyltransferase [Aureococcus anophagefferens]|uniref:O-acyltransferase n=1 Tax=Aureococcus anophagefferens TaxID=44056 RepID=A0ABR1GAP3_AURAN